MPGFACGDQLEGSSLQDCRGISHLRKLPWCAQDESRREAAAGGQPDGTAAELRGVCWNSCGGIYIVECAGRQCAGTRWQYDWNTTQRDVIEKDCSTRVKHTNLSGVRQELGVGVDRAELRWRPPRQLSAAAAAAAGCTE